jgi:hypothetical protein
MPIAAISSDHISLQHFNFFTASLMFSTMSQVIALPNQSDRALLPHRVSGYCVDATDVCVCIYHRTLMRGGAEIDSE